MTDKSKGGMPRQPWHYDALEGRPEWSKEMSRQRVIQRQKVNEDTRRAARLVANGRR